jgi:hypothetical protein
MGGGERGEGKAGAQGAAAEINNNARFHTHGILLLQSPLQVGHDNARTCAVPVKRRWSAAVFSVPALGFRV